MRRALAAVTAIALCWAVAACQDDSSPDPAPEAEETAITAAPAPQPPPDRGPPDRGPPDRGPPDTEWLLHGNDVGEQRFSPLAQINRDNVGELGLAWHFDMYTRRGVEATPLMVDGTLYATGSWSMVYALDAKTGELKWFYDPQVDRSFLARGCCDAVNRGVAYRDGRVLVATYDGRLVALNAEDGKVIWDVQTTDREQSYTITGAPRLVKNLVVIGNGGAELGVRGYVSAYRIDTGEMAWRFYTVPGNPADGFENEAMKMAAQTWSGDWWKFGGGGTAWDSMVYDPALDLLYIGVGNGSPWNQAVRSPGGGDNLFLSSIVALKPDTGEYVWHYQTTPGDTWDFTATQHIMLAELEIDGAPRKVLMQAPKNGFFYVIDRASGELISADPYTSPITWASHVDMETGRPVERPEARTFDGKNISLPSNAGAHNWPAMSYNPQTGLVYIPTMVFPAAFLAPTEDKDRLPGQGYWNVGFDRMGNAPPPIPEAELAAVIDRDFSGRLIAWDPLKREIRWAQQPGRPNTGGTLSTAGGLVFHGGLGTRVVATDAVTGEDLWSQDTQTGAWAPPITYAIDGEQYIAFAVGFGGGLAAEGGPVAHSWGIVNRSRVLVYKLGGADKLPTPPEDDRVMPKPAPVTADADTVRRGQVVYQRHCAYCHGDGLRTGRVTPDLRWSSENVHGMWQDIVRGGILKSLGMVSFADYVSEDEAEAVRQYVLAEATRRYAELHPAAE
jgi:PQQ-dependent dehydrogenase (methanol/ethanol family)